MQLIIKRTIDIILSLVALIVLSPVMLIVAIMIYIKLGSPVIFNQTRVGKDNKLFKMYKFRTMLDANDKFGIPLPDEVRLTNFGKKLRSTSLDELPGLWNVLIGNMSLVGPRPLLVEYLPLYSKEQIRRHNMKPGITGLAQVKGRNSISWSEKFKLDIEYIDDFSIFNDVKILFLTVKTVLIREGISSENSITMEKFDGNN